MSFIGDCRDEELVIQLFGSVTDFARHVEENGDDSTLENIIIKYNPITDIHDFYQERKE